MGEGTGGWSLLTLFDCWRLQLIYWSKVYLNLTVVFIFSPLPPKQFNPFNFPTPVQTSVFCDLKLIMFYMLFPQRMSFFFFGGGGPYGRSQMIYQSLRKFLLCSSCVLHHCEDEAVFQHSCVARLFHKHRFTLFISLGNGHVDLWVCCFLLPLIS